jgi:hypothetical protein
VLKTLLPRNEAMWDRVLRVVLGIVVLSLTVWGPKSLWGLVGLLPLVTGLAGSCPAYSLLGLRTCAAAEARTPQA